MENLINSIKQSLYNPDVNPLLRRFFKYVLKRDRKQGKLTRDFPTPFARTLHNLSIKTGIKFVDKKNNDYTLEPLILQYADLFGGKKSIITKFLLVINRKIYGGFTNLQRYEHQLKMLVSYREYSDSAQATLMLDYLIDKDQSYYTKKILHVFRENKPEDGSSLKTFIIGNKDYFAEVRAFFLSKERPEVSCLDDAIAELESRIKACKRDNKLKITVGVAAFELISMILMMGTKIIPDILADFEASITEFSPIIIYINSISTFIVYRWYLAIILIGLGIMIVNTIPFKIFIGFLSLKSSILGEYVINSQLSRFLNSYKNLSRLKIAPDAFEDSLPMLTNHYLLFVMSDFIRKDGDFNMKDFGLSFFRILQDVPYIPKEYIDIIKEHELTGNPLEGVEQVLKIIDTRLAVLSERTTKLVMAGAIYISVGIVALAVVSLIDDMNIIMESSNAEFVKQLKQ